MIIYRGRRDNYHNVSLRKRYLKYYVNDHVPSIENETKAIRKGAPHDVSQGTQELQGQLTEVGKTISGL